MIYVNFFFNIGIQVSDINSDSDSSLGDRQNLLVLWFGEHLSEELMANSEIIIFSHDLVNMFFRLACVNSCLFS